MQWRRMLMWSSRLLQDDGQQQVRVRTDLVRLIPFDVQIALQRPAPTVSGNALLDLVTDWMNEAFRTKAMNQGLISNDLNSNSSSTTFQTVALERNQRQRSLRALQAEQPDLFTASFTGVSLWERRGSDVEPIDPEFVELIQRATFLEDNKLLVKLQSADPSTGLGFSVLNVGAFLTPPSSNNGTVTGNNLEVIIIIAIVVACMAFALLMFAVLWAWRTDRTKRDAYKVDGAPPRQALKRTPDGTGSESDYDQEPPPHVRTGATGPPHHPNHLPSEITPQPYPDSVISEDISTSLTAYYKSGMTGYNIPRREMNDAASMSSMDSYGYSLDGYAPSLSGGPTQLGYPVGPIDRISQFQDTESLTDGEALEVEQSAAMSTQEDTTATDSDNVEEKKQ